jgi:hypothetical protein
MGILKPVLILAILSSALLCTPAWATEPPPRAGAVRDEVKPAPPARPGKETPNKKPAKRRAVHQIIDGMPAPAPPQAYGPTLNPAPAIAQPMASPVPPGPAIGNGCTGPACLDAGGGSYKGGVGTTLISPQGRLCSNNGMTVQCF